MREYNNPTHDSEPANHLNKNIQCCTMGKSWQMRINILEQEKS